VTPKSEGSKDLHTKTLDYYICIFSIAKQYVLLGSILLPAFSRTSSTHGVYHRNEDREATSYTLEHAKRQV
jgi:hypothetical protein